MDLLHAPFDPVALAVPFFVFAGDIMAQGGIARSVVVWPMSMI